MRNDAAVPGPVRVAVASRYPVVAEGLASLLARHPDRVTVVGLPARIHELEADVVLYDAIGMHKGEGLDLNHLIEATSAAVLIVGHELRPELTSRALERGADGFFSLSVGADELVAGVLSAATGWQEGDTGPNPTVGSSDSAAEDVRLGGDVGLSSREVDILRLVTQGRSNTQIASELFLSVNSIKTYIRTAYRKIGVQTRTQAVAWALKNGFTSDLDHGPGPRR